MYLFKVEKEFDVDYCDQWKHYSAVVCDEVPLKHIYLSGTMLEILRVHERWKRSTKHSGNIKVPITMYKEKFFSAWESFPSQLGQHQDCLEETILSPASPQKACCPAAPPPGTGTISVKEDSAHKNTIILQLESLRRNNPEKTHFRIVIINGFGTNLGDNLMGTTALSVLTGIMEKELPSFSFDIILGYGSNSANADILRDVAQVEQIFPLGMSVEEFGRYDAFFDFSGLIALPFYNTMPIIDWYLWWMGVDPAAIPPEKKRNRMSIRKKSWNRVQATLKSRYKNSDHTHIYFNPKASSPLRSIPVPQAAKLAKAFLETDKNIDLLIDQPLDVKHPRLIDVSKEIYSPEAFKALVAQCDGMITVNTFGSHVADAADVPFVHIDSVLPPEIFPYYPHMAGMNIPDAENLPAWGKSKVDNEKEWPDMEKTYALAWEKLDHKKVLHALKKKMKQVPEDVSSRLRLLDAPVTRSCLGKNSDGGHIFLRQSSSEVWRNGQEITKQIIHQVVKPGMTCILAGAGEPSLPLILAEKVGNQGQAHIFDPRHVHLQLAGAACTEKEIFTARFHNCLPVANAKQAKLPAFDPWSPCSPDQWGNVPGSEMVHTLSLDDLNLPYCSLLIIQPPMPFTHILEGGATMLTSLRPLLCIGPIEKENAAPVCAAAGKLGFTFQAASARSDQSMDQFILMGTPREQPLELNGFVRVNY